MSNTTKPQADVVPNEIAELLTEPCWNLSRRDVSDLLKRIGSILYTAPQPSQPVEAAGVLDVQVFDENGVEVQFYPAELNDDLKRILGMPNFACIPYAQAFRSYGYAIKHKAEEEQAFTIDWLLRQYLKGGTEQIGVALKEIADALGALREGDKNCVHELDMDIETGDGRALMSCSKCGFQKYVPGKNRESYRTA
jgi:hypothetical protein